MKVGIKPKALLETKWYEYAVRFIFGGVVTALAGVIALLFLFILGVVRMLGFAFLLVAYVLGPLMLPLGLVPETAGYCAAWGKHTPNCSSGRCSGRSSSASSTPTPPSFAPARKELPS